ncbi:Type 1 glutamine amidotransferase-like domain-containing protein [Actinoplanes sp. CA-054009]
MKLLLTDSGVRNAGIREALLDLLGKPIDECSALCIPTAGYGGASDPFLPWEFISGRSPDPMTGLGWKSVGILELTALPSIEEERWVSWVRDADVLLVNGGVTQYLGHWMRESGLADLLPSLSDQVYVGLSAGSVVMTPSELGLVDFSLLVHLGQPGRSMAEAEQWGAGLAGPGYAIDAETAITVVDGAVEVVSEGRWRSFSGAG